MKKILLIQPSPYDKNHKPVKKNKLYFVGLAMPLLAAMLPEGWDAEIVLEIKEDIPFDTDAELIGISTIGHGVIRSIDIAREFRERGKTVIFGGYMASIMAEEALKHCDSLVVGDAELVWHDLIRDYEEGKLKKIYEKNLEKGFFSTPLPRFDLIVNKKIGDFLPVQAGRGVPTHAVCPLPASIRVLYQATKEVMRDIKQVKDLGFKSSFSDDNTDREYLDKLLMEIKSLKMEWMSQCDIRIGRDDELLKKLSDSGCTTLSFGLESISKESLKGMNKAWANPDEYPDLIKNIHSYGIDVSTEMVVGGEGDTLQSIRDTKFFIEDNKITVPRFYILTPIPGTKFFKDMAEEGRIIREDIYSFDGREAVHLPKNMTPGELTAAYWDLY